MIAFLLAALIVIVPHGDDETTVLPDIVAAGDNAIVVVMTDGAATSRCTGTYQACEERRYDATRRFLKTVAPDAELVWIGARDGELTTSFVELVAVNMCDGCRLLGAGADYGHPDHDAVRAGVRAVGGSVYDGSLYRDEVIEAAVDEFYGWLVNDRQLRLLGLG